MKSFLNMEYQVLLVTLLIVGIITFGVYLTITTVANKIFEKQKWNIRSKNIEITLPLRLQAYERMCLFLERITPSNLLLRLVPSAMSALELQQILLQEIRDEYNHNVAQQLYISTHAWEQITNAMNETVAVINQAASEVSGEAPPSDLAKKIFSHVIEKETQPAAHALKVLKEEIRAVF
jgi:thiaminase